MGRTAPWWGKGTAVLYRSKPQVVDAVQWTGDNWDSEIVPWGRQGPDADLFVLVTTGGRDGQELRLRAGKGGAQGLVPVPVGHWIIHNPGDWTDLWPVDPDYFAAKYEREAWDEPEGVDM